MNKKGTSMVEAAVVFPLVILAVAALIQILVFFYQLTETNVKMHLALRAESGSISQTVIYETAEEPPFPVYKAGNRLYYSARLSFLEKGILRQIHKDIAARHYINRESAAIRSFDLAGAAAETE